MDPLMTSDEVAAILKVDVVTIRRLVSRGELPAYRVGNEYRFTETDLEDYLKRQRVPGREEAGPHAVEESAAWWQKMLFSRGGKGAGDRDRFDRFTAPARRVLTEAQVEAQRFQHNYIGTEHLLLGLLREKEGLAIQVLSNLGVVLNDVRARIESIIGKGERTAPGEVGLTRRARKVIELAVEEAQRIHHNYVGTEHLLLGLVREGEGIAAQVLKDIGVDLTLARAEMAKVLREGPVTPPPVPEQASALLAEGEEGLTCSHCGAHCPTYFNSCFNCGTHLERT